MQEISHEKIQSQNARDVNGNVNRKDGGGDFVIYADMKIVDHTQDIGAMQNASDGDGGGRGPTSMSMCKKDTTQ